MSRHFSFPDVELAIQHIESPIKVLSAPAACGSDALHAGAPACATEGEKLPVRFFEFFLMAGFPMQTLRAPLASYAFAEKRSLADEFPDVSFAGCGDGHESGRSTLSWCG
jgi:hypothetical protein